MKQSLSTSKIIQTISVVTLLSSGSIYSQTFTSVSGNIADIGRSEVIWADYDNDGDADLFISGLGSGDQLLTQIYRNDEGAMTLLPSSFEGYKETDGCWGDMDDDGDLDLIIAGNTNNGDQTRIYLNEPGGFTEIDPGMINVQNGDVCWVDYDNDGDLDAFVTGNWMARIYQNQEGTFVDTGQDLGYFSSSAADWGDFDNDGDLDLLILGDSGAGAVTRIFRNDKLVFNEVDTGLYGLMAGCCDWVDYDNDGDLDISIAGNDDALEAQFLVYKNTGNGNFEQLSFLFEGFALGDADWGDFDNDGDLDVIYSGKCTGCGVNVSGIYRNDGDDEFYHLTDIFPALMRCSLQWVDYDNDGDLDFAVAGTTLSGTPQTYMFRNNDGSNLFVMNTAPSVPSGLEVETLERKVILSWEKSTDVETPQDALSYNVRVGQTSEGGEIVTAMAIVDNGFRKISAMGNTGLMDCLILENLEPGTYYWSVQAIDQAFLGSGFSIENSFEILATSTEDIEVSPGLAGFYPNPATDLIHLTPNVLEGGVSIEVADLSGRRYIHSRVEEWNDKLDVSGLSPGIYILTVRGDNKSLSQKLLIQ